MHKIAVPADEVVSLHNVAPGVAGLRLLIVNIFAVVDPHGWTLIDAGLNGSSGPIRRWARRHWGDTPPRAIVLTHAHFDHVGALGDLLRDWDVPVYVHPEERAFVTGERAYPPPDPSVGGGVMARMASLYPRAPISLDGRVRDLPADGSIPTLPGWRWIHTPGHTPGHISLFRDSDRVLIAGDAFCTTKQESLLAVATERAELHGPPAYFTTDWDKAGESVRRLAALRPMTIAPGHGRPMRGAMTSRALERLAEQFDVVARPARGRYVEHPSDAAPSDEPFRTTERAAARLTNRAFGAAASVANTISPAEHALLDYGVAGTFLALGFAVRARNPSAAALAFMNGASILALSMLTDYPGGVFRKLSFRTHRTGDIAQAALAGFGPVLFGFAGEPEAAYFYGQAASEVGVIAATDWDAGD